MPPKAGPGARYCRQPVTQVMKRSNRSLRSKSPTSRKGRSEGPIRPTTRMPVINPHAGGLDVGSTEHYVCVPTDSVSDGQDSVRSFGTFTQDLDQLVEWLRQCGVQTVAMESTGVYWVPIYQKLEEAGIKPVLANARHLRQVPGRKTDVKDCQWLQQLHSYGLIEGSFRPTPEVCRLRSLLRYRANLVSQKGLQVQYMQRALQEMNILLHQVVSDLDGDTGFRILDAILDGQRDPDQLVTLRDPHIKRSSVDEMKAALQGDWREEQLLILGLARKTYRFFEDQISRCDQAIQQQLKTMPSAPVPATTAPKDSPAAPMPDASAEPPEKKKRKRKSGGNEPSQDLMPELIRICGVDLSQMGGFNLLSILVLISEMGVDMSRWRSEKALSSWLGLAPGNKISGGRILSSRTPYVANRIATLLRTVALAVGRTDTWLGAFHRRMRARLGPAGAATATAHKLACLVYHLLKTKEPYVDINRLVYEEKIQRQRVGRLRKQAEELGFQLVEIQVAE
jgi:transposase